MDASEHRTSYICYQLGQNSLLQHKSYLYDSVHQLRKRGWWSRKRIEEVFQCFWAKSTLFHCVRSGALTLFFIFWERLRPLWPYPLFKKGGRIARLPRFEKTVKTGNQQQ